MIKGIVVVESPAKAKTLGSYLGSEYKVLASYGHIRDLVSKDGSVDPSNHYKMLWEFNDRGRKQLKEIAESLKLSKNLFLATDPDREGEAISWHILESLKEKKVLNDVKVQRVVFHEITKNAILQAFNEPKSLDKHLVDAYLARRVLDYLVGFSLSPILWRKMPGAKSAGRVQSVALRMIVERELEIQAFKSEEYWSIHADFQAIKGDFSATLHVLDKEKLEKFDIKNEESANIIKSRLEKEQYFIEKVEKKSVKRNPYAPFTTSTLQQDAVRKLGFSAKKTMQVAQKLYEGISINGSMSGLITYMRTDSTALSDEAIEGVRSYILDAFGEKYLPKSKRLYKTKTKNAQEAHEAIRPTSFMRSPESIAGSLSNDELRLYELIWKRTVASQMETAIIDQVTVDISSKAGSAVFRAKGSTIAFEGFLRVYEESSDNEEESQKKLPALQEMEDVSVLSINGDQHFTQPPPRFNEASLVKKLEELGIGRPSTYASIINVLQDRGYVRLQKRTFIPESVGYLATSFLRNFFQKYIQYDFTANLEEELDEISKGELIWEGVLDRFWNEFKGSIDSAKTLTITEVIDHVEKDISQYIFRDVGESRNCPACLDGRVNLKLGRYGAFLGCSRYPECKYIKSLGGGDDVTHMLDSQIVEAPKKVEIGRDSRNDNDVVSLKKGPFGYYFEWERMKDPRDEKGKKPKRLAAPKFISEPSEMTIEQVVFLDSLPVVLGVHPLKKKEIQLIIGRFGPYLKMGDKSFKVEKDRSFLDVDLTRAIEIIDSE